jgi:hypothetical protein
VQIAGLVGTGWLVWKLSILPRLAFQTPGRLVSQALGYALLACGVSAVITAALYLLMARSWHREVLPFALRTSATAIWFAPATILLSTLSPVTAAAALVLVVSATRLIYSEWRGFLPEAPASLSRVPSFALAVVLQAAIVSMLSGSPLAAALLVCLSISLLTLLLLMAGLAAVKTRKNLPNSILGLVLTMILAAGLTTTSIAVFGLLPQVPEVSLWRASRRVLRNLFSTRQRPAPVLAVHLVAPPEDDTNIVANGYPGVILWPEVKPQTILAPPPQALLRRPGDPTAQEPSTIFFSGEYWMFRAPNVRPPLRSYFRRASPLGLSFTSLGHIALRMEAHQRLDHAIDLSCCGAIQVAITNADRYPGSVMLELILADVSSEGSKSLLLGTAEVASWPRYGSNQTISETLNFTVPNHISIREFNEISVVFHFDTVRDDRSARIAIDRFVLIPPS